MKNFIYSFCFIFTAVLTSMSCYGAVDSVEPLESSDGDILGFVDYASEIPSELDASEDVATYIVFEDEEADVVVAKTPSKNINVNRVAPAEVVLSNVDYSHDEQTKERLILSRCLLGEGGWSNRNDWNGILSVLINRSKTVTRWQNRPVYELAAQYCHALWPNRRHSQWINNLTFGDMENPPEGWPANMPWNNYRNRWNVIQDFVEEVMEGNRELNSCPATHWGSRTDGAPVSWQVIGCGDTNNVFYR